jgi:hypothetical protein
MGLLRRGKLLCFFPGAWGYRLLPVSHSWAHTLLKGHLRYSILHKLLNPGVSLKCCGLLLSIQTSEGFKNRSSMSCTLQIIFLLVDLKHGGQGLGPPFFLVLDNSKLMRSKISLDQTVLVTPLFDFLELFSTATLSYKPGFSSTCSMAVTRGHFYGVVVIITRYGSLVFL